LGGGGELLEDFRLSRRVLGNLTLAKTTDDSAVSVLIADAGVEEAERNCLYRRQRHGEFPFTMHAATISR